MFLFFWKKKFFLVQFGRNNGRNALADYFFLKKRAWMFLMCFYILGKKKKPRDLINCVLKKKKVEQSSDNRCVLWRTARELVFESSFKWHTFLFLTLFCLISPISQKFNSCVTDGRTDGRADGRTDGRMDGWTHLV